MNLENVMENIGEPDSVDLFRPGWEASLQCLPKGRPDFLDPRHLRDIMVYAGIDPFEHDPVARVAARIASDPALTRFAWHCRRLLFSFYDYPRANIAKWPSLTHVLEADAAYFYFILALSSVDDVRILHRQRRIPSTITRDTCADVGRFRPCNAGIRVYIPGTLTWLRHAVAGRLFKVGRLQFIHDVFRGPLLVFRHGASGDVLALAEGGMRFNSEGYFDGDGGIRDPNARTTRLKMDDRQVTGTAISPHGYAVHCDVRLRLDEWILLMVRETPALDIHIPPVEPMPPEATAESMRKGVAFFRRYLPDKPFRALACSSWLFNTQWPAILGKESNIVAWQREQYLYPVPSAEPAGLPFIFGFVPFNLKTAARDTRLRRGATELLERGKPLRNGGMFGLPEDLPHFGNGYYRAGWLRTCKRLGLPPKLRTEDC